MGPMTYRSGRKLALIAFVLVALQMASQAYLGVAALLTLIDNSNASMLLSASGYVMFSVVLYIATLVVFMMWVHRTVANLTALGSENLMEPSSAVWSFFIPFVNIWRPHEVLSTIWRESQPVSVNEAGFAIPARAGIVTAWWAGVVVATFGSQFIRMFGMPTTHAELDNLLVALTVAAALWMFAGVLFIRMVRSVQHRQDEQWNDLELRRAAPLPDPNALR